MEIIDKEKTNINFDLFCFRKSLKLNFWLILFSDILITVFAFWKIHQFDISFKLFDNIFNNFS